MSVPYKYLRRNKAWRIFNQNKLVKRRLIERGYHRGSSWVQRFNYEYHLIEPSNIWIDNMAEHIERGFRDNNFSWRERYYDKEDGCKWKAKYYSRRSRLKVKIRKDLIDEGIL